MSKQSMPRTEAEHDDAIEDNKLCACDHPKSQHHYRTGRCTDSNCNCIKFEAVSGKRGYEYIRLEVDMGDLEKLNRFSGDGWHVVAVVPGRWHDIWWFILERPLP